MTAVDVITWPSTYSVFWIERERTVYVPRLLDPGPVYHVPLAARTSQSPRSHTLRASRPSRLYPPARYRPVVVRRHGWLVVVIVAVTSCTSSPAPHPTARTPAAEYARYFFVAPRDTGVLEVTASRPASATRRRATRQGRSPSSAGTRVRRRRWRCIGQQAARSVTAR